MTLATTAAPNVSAVSAPIPANACDTHSHVFGPFDRFPPLRPSVYALPEADPATHAAARRALGVRYGVLTQPAPYADDPSAMLAAVAGGAGALRAVAVATPDTAESILAAWQTAGVVGLRFTEMRAPNGERYPGSVPFDALEVLAPRMRALGLHAQLWATAQDLAKWLPRLLRLDLTLVLDHMGCPNVGGAVVDHDFAAILAALRSDRVWVKLVLARVSRRLADAADARPFHDALVAQAPHRMLWGSDWPYVRMAPAPDAAVMLTRFCAWVPDAATRHAILVDNPAVLYGFAGGPL